MRLGSWLPSARELISFKAGKARLARHHFLLSASLRSSLHPLHSCPRQPVPLHQYLKSLCATHQSFGKWPDVSCLPLSGTPSLSNKHTHNTPDIAASINVKRTLPRERLLDFTLSRSMNGRQPRSDLMGRRALPTPVRPFKLITLNRSHLRAHLSHPSGRWHPLRILYHLVWGGPNDANWQHLLPLRQHKQSTRKCAV